jgi:hypothetical protein
MAAPLHYLCNPNILVLYHGPVVEWILRMPPEH